MGELTTHEEIAEKFQELRGQGSQIAGRLHDLAADKAVSVCKFEEMKL